MSDFTTSKLIPPFRYAIVEDGVFRGAYPTEKNCRFLHRLKLKTIVTLTPKKPSKVMIGFAEQEGIALKHFHVPKFKDDVPISSSQVVQILQLIIDPNNLPVYIHCLDGANITGLVIMCLRKLQNFSLSLIFTEFGRFTRAGSLSSSESEFIETFKAEIEIGPSLPPWLWQGVRCTKHPTLKLKLVNPPGPSFPAPPPPSSSSSASSSAFSSTSSHPHHHHHHHHTARDKQKQKDLAGIRKEFESGGKFSNQTESPEKFSRDLQALDLEGVAKPNHPKMV